MFACTYWRTLEIELSQRENELERRVRELVVELEKKLRNFAVIEQQLAEFTQTTTVCVN